MTELTKELKKNLKTYNKEQLNNLLCHACQDGRLDIVKYLLTSPDLKEHADIHINNDEGFRKACEEGHLDVVKYLLTSPELTEHADIHAGGDYGFQWACINGHLNVVSYLLTSPDLNEHADIHIHNDGGFKEACRHGQVNIIKYLLSFNGEQCINFQQTDYNLVWAMRKQYAMKKQYDGVILAMMLNLKNNNPFEYIDYLPKIEEYNKEVYERVKNVEIDNDEINSSPYETVLFL